MPFEHIRLTQPEKIEEVHEIVVGQRLVALVGFAAQATHYPLLIAPDDAVLHFGYEKSYGGGDRGAGYYYVALMEFAERGAYPLMLGEHLDAGYVKEKLGLKTVACANNVTALLRAVGSEDVRAFLETVPLQGDHVDHYKVEYGSGFLHVEN